MARMENVGSPIDEDRLRWLDHARADDNGMAPQLEKSPQDAEAQIFCSSYGTWMDKYDHTQEDQAHARADDNGMAQLPEKSPEIRRLLTSLLDGMTSAQRKEYPFTTGGVDYFRDAWLYISHVSFKGNQKHNPGEPLHWARDKSADEPDAIGRHLCNRDNVDDNELLEAGELAWRACADLQKLLEKKYHIKPPRGCK